ncbi:hypothetical protein GQG94_004730 [Salmonella enterica]|nr:hypothetical protein [Salmonella enterica subsp. enterica serovar Mbandaka]EEJ1220425.1 hypothetical protein [Salmonella enterica]ELK3355870.1 hypothetical protein [Salmonella enterica]
MKNRKKKVTLVTKISSLIMTLLGVIGGGFFVVNSFIGGYNPVAKLASIAGNELFKDEIFAASITGFISIWKNKELFSSDFLLILSGLMFIIVVGVLTFYLIFEFALIIDHWICFFYIRKEYGGKFARRWQKLHSESVKQLRDKVLNSNSNSLINEKNQLEKASYEHYLKWKEHYESSLSYKDWKKKVLKEN